MIGQTPGRKPRHGLACLAAALTLLAGCAAAPPDRGLADVDSLLSQRTGLPVTWNHGAGPDRTSLDLARRVLARPLQPEGAVQVALLRNRLLQASFADIGLAQADLAQAGLLQNPVLDTSIRFPDRLFGITEVAAGLSENLLNLILLPARKQVAAAQTGAIQFRVAAEVLDLVADMRTAYWRLRADQAVGMLLRDRVAAADATAALAGRLHAAGNLNDLDLARAQAEAEAIRAEYADALAAGAGDREDMNRLMGLFGNDAAAWSVPDDVPAPPPDRLPYDRLEAMAIAGNLRIASLRLQAEASAKALGIVRDYGWLTDIDAGISTEKNPEGYRVTGPSLRLALPLFDRGQARQLRAAAVLAQDEDSMAQLAIEARARVRAIRDRLIRTRDLADRYASVIVPLRRRILTLGVRQYDFMLVSPFDLLRAKQDEITASRRLIEARRDYWTQMAELGRALGGPADLVSSAAASAPALPPPALPPLALPPLALPQLALKENR